MELFPNNGQPTRTFTSSIVPRLSVSGLVRQLLPASVHKEHLGRLTTLRELSPLKSVTALTCQVTFSPGFLMPGRSGHGLPSKPLHTPSRLTICSLLNNSRPTWKRSIQKPSHLVTGSTTKPGTLSQELYRGLTFRD